MENSSPEPPGSSPPEFDLIDVDLTPNREPNTIPPVATFHQFLSKGLELSSDPINSTNSFEFTPIPQIQSRTILNRKRPANNNLGSHIDKEPRTSNLGSENETTALILQARDLIVKAYTTTPNRNIQARLLDLLEVFREYTEKGQIHHVSTILATQVANLEQTARKVELQARQPKIQAQSPKKASNSIPKTTTYATVASSPNSSSGPNSPNSTLQEWTLVSKNKGSSTGISGIRPNSSTRENSKRQEYRNSGPSKLALSKRCTLLQALKVQANSFSALKIRNLINSAFNKNGVQEQVISTVSLSFRGNIVVNTTPEFNSDFLIENQAIIKGVLPLITSLKKGEPWYKVAIHGIPFREFDNSEGMDLILSEIRTFNKGLEPIGRPYWATPKERRISGEFTSGTIIVAFPNEEQAKRAISNRLYIGGISTKVVKYISTPSTSQCNKCAGFGHSELLCKRKPKCILCAENHILKNHYCSICKNKGIRCSHTITKCANCENTTHFANSKLCEVYLAIKNKASNTLNNEL
jgi:hypothetical protein